MKFRVRTYTKDRHFVDDNPVMWIKATREELGCGLREAKDLCDTLRSMVRQKSDMDRSNPRHTTSVIVDTDQLTFLKFLESAMAKKSERHIADSIQSHPVPKSADDILKQTAIRLIRMNEYSKAIDVLKIVI